MLILDRLQALGTYWWIDSYDAVAEVQPTARIMQETITQFERYYSRFRDESLITKLNRERVLKDAPDDLIEMLELGQEIGTMTGHAFSLGLGGVLEQWGYDKYYSFSLRGPVSLLPVRISRKGTTVRLEGHGNVDLGGIGKGYLIRKLSLRLKEMGIRHFMINGGGDVYATSNRGKPVKIYLQHPHEEDRIFADVMLKDSTVCVSSPFKRSWTDEKTGKIFTHIVNPHDSETDYSRLTSSVVIGSDPALTDALATAFCIMDERACKKIAEKIRVRFRKIPLPRA